MTCEFPACMQAHENRSTGATDLSAQKGLDPLFKRPFALHFSKPCLIITPSMTSAFCACMQAHEHRSTGASSLSAQEGLVPLLKRLFILHSSKLMALAVFWAAMQQPGAIGWLLTCKSSQSSGVIPCSSLLALFWVSPYNCWVVTCAA